MIDFMNKILKITLFFRDFNFVILIRYADQGAKIKCTLPLWYF